MSFKLSIGKLAILGVDGYHNEAIIAIHPFATVLRDYFFKCLNGFDLAAGNKAAIKGNTLNQDSISNILIALPPEEEIPRVVTKVDELMALCDKLEAQQQQKTKLAKLSRAAALDALVSANGSTELNRSWARVQGALKLWAHEPQAIREFRNVAGALAYRGMLTEGVVLPAGNAGSDALPDLPAGWKWETLGSLTEYITSGSRGWKTYLASSGDTFIRSQDIKQDALVFENPVFVALPEKVEGKRTLVQPGDLLLTITGGNVGKCARVPALDVNAYVSQHVALIRLKQPEQSEFIHSWMTNLYGGRRFLARYIYGDKPGLNLSQVASVPVPVPPPDVQESVVKQLQHYGKLCDQLIWQVENASRIAEAFAAASIATITGIRTEEEEELKVPKTQLIAKLRLVSSPTVKEQAPLAAILARHQNEMTAGDLWQRFGGEIDAFYAQLKLEVGKGCIAEPAVAEMREVEAG